MQHHQEHGVFEDPSSYLANIGYQTKATQDIRSARGLLTSRAGWSIDPKAPKPLQTLHKLHTLDYRPPEESFSNHHRMQHRLGHRHVEPNPNRLSIGHSVSWLYPGSRQVVNCNMIGMEQLALPQVATTAW